MSVREQLARAPVAEAVGIVDAWGARISRAGDQPWTVKIVLEAWRLAHGEMRNVQLSLYQEGTFEDLKAMRGLIKPFDVFRVRVQVLEAEATSPQVGWLVEVIGEDKSDSELNVLAKAFREPVSYRDDTLGTFLLDRRLSRFEGDARWNGHPVRLTLGVGKDQNAEPAAAVAHQLWNSSALWNERVYEFAVRHFRKLKNERWLQTDEPEVAEGSFRERLKLQSIEVRTNGKFEFWFDDDDLFWGHAIRISGNLTEGPVSAGLEG